MSPNKWKNTLRSVAKSGINSQKGNDKIPNVLKKSQDIYILDRKKIQDILDGVAKETQTDNVSFHFQTKADIQAIITQAAEKISSDIVHETRDQDVFKEDGIVISFGEISKIINLDAYRSEAPYDFMEDIRKRCAEECRRVEEDLGLGISITKLLAMGKPGTFDSEKITPIRPLIISIGEDGELTFST